MECPRCEEVCSQVELMAFGMCRACWEDEEYEEYEEYEGPRRYD